MERRALLGFTETQPYDSLGAEKVRYALRTQQFYSFLDTANLCQFVWGPAWSLFGPQETIDAVRAVTGWTDFDIDELMAIGERRINLMRAFNAREGIDRANDTLPAKFFKPLTGHRAHPGRRAGPRGHRGRAGRVLPSRGLGRRHRQPDRGDAGAPGTRRRRLSWVCNAPRRAPRMVMYTL